MYREISVCFILFFFVRLGLGGQIDNPILPKEFFSPTEGVKKIHVVGVVRYAGASEFGRAQCPSPSICLHSPEWHIYEIVGYVLPNRDDITELRVAHRYGSALYTGAPWLATLEEISNKELRKKLKADYLLVGVELGDNVFCPDDKTKDYFRGWEFDLIIKKTRKGCFLL